MFRDDDFSAPACARFAAMWDRMATQVRELSPGQPIRADGDKSGVPASLDAVRQSDAYHSLSIEGYKVTPELIQRAADPDCDFSRMTDEERPHALAARGYLNAFDLVNGAIGDGVSGKTLAASYEGWYQALFQPLLESHGLTKASIMGYRRHVVFLPGSKHVPAAWETVPDLMQVYREKLSEEASPMAQAVLGHFGFGFIHPYQDGNGRVSRFIMNAALVAAGNPWTVIHVENRGEYLKALEAASSGDDIEPFARFVQKEMAASPSSALPEVPRVPRHDVASPARTAPEVDLSAGTR